MRLLLVLAFASISLAACNASSPTAASVDIPADHTSRHGSAWHKPGLRTPFAASSGCSDGNCHQADLRGGDVVFEGRTVSTPSCYSCHGVKWQG